MTNLFRTEQERRVTLTQTERENVLKISPLFTTIKEAVYFDNYDLPCPIRVELVTKTGKTMQVVLRKNRHGDVHNEVRIFKALRELGLPVPEVLLEPFEIESEEYAAIYSLLPGENLQKLSMREDGGLDMAKNLLVEAVLRLSSITPEIKDHNVAEIIPQLSLTTELESLNAEDNVWLENDQYQTALKEVRAKLKSVNTPLILSNGDYQPGNFLAQDGKLTGFLDFESASFQDPLMGFVKYPIYDMIPLSRTGLVEIFLKKSGFSKRDFNLRLALGCLKTLKKEIPVLGGDTEMNEYRTRILKLLAESL